MPVGWFQAKERLASARYLIRRIEEAKTTNTAETPGDGPIHGEHYSNGWKGGVFLRKPQRTKNADDHGAIPRVKTHSSFVFCQDIPPLIPPVSFCEGIKRAENTGSEGSARSITPTHHFCKRRRNTVPTTLFAFLVPWSC